MNDQPPSDPRPEPSKHSKLKRIEYKSYGDLLLAYIVVAGGEVGDLGRMQRDLGLSDDELEMGLEFLLENGLIHVAPSEILH